MVLVSLIARRLEMTKTVSGAVRRWCVWRRASFVMREPAA